MLKHPVYLLSGPEGTPVVAGSRWGRTALVVLARHLCVHFSLDVRGVPVRRTEAFVQLNAPRQAPFADADGAYVRQGDVLHVWAWPRALSELANETAGAGSAVIPETLLGQAVAQGAVFRNCVAGIEALRFDGGLLVDNAWWPVAPTAEEQLRWARAAPVVVESLEAQPRAATAVLWPRGWRPLPRPGALARAPGAALGLRRHAFLLAGWGTLALSLGYLGWANGEARGLNSAELRAQAALDRAVARARGAASAPTVERRDPGAADERWLNQARNVARGLDVQQAWAALAPRLAAEGLLVREFSFERGDVKLTLVSGFGTEVDLAAAVTAVESTGLWRQVELLDLANPLAVRLSAKPRASVLRTPS